ncbi:hypothetical protein GINT2_001624 [Glugoides intestinalis]
MSIDTTEDSTSKDQYTQLKKLTEQLNREKIAFSKSMANFIAVENEFDQRGIDKTCEPSRRRKAHVFKTFEFQGASNRAILEDLNVIYDGVTEEEVFGNENFKRNDTVLCVVNNKKYKGKIISISQKGIVVRTKDKRKIRIFWEDIEDEEAKITKIDEERSE